MKYPFIQQCLNKLNYITGNTTLYVYDGNRCKVISDISEQRAKDLMYQLAQQGIKAKLGVTK